MPDVFRSVQQALCFASACAATLQASSAAALQLAEAAQGSKDHSIALPYPFIALKSIIMAALGGARPPRFLSDLLSASSTAAAFANCSPEILPSLPQNTHVPGTKARKRPRSQSSRSTSATLASLATQLTKLHAEQPRSSKIARFIRSGDGGRALVDAIGSIKVPKAVDVTDAGASCGGFPATGPVLLYVDLCGPAPWAGMQQARHSAAASDMHGTATEAVWEQRWMFMDAVRFAALLPHLAEERLVVWQPKQLKQLRPTHYPQNDKQTSLLPGRLPLKLVSAIVDCHRGSQLHAMRGTGGNAKELQLSCVQLASLWLAYAGGVWGTVTKTLPASKQWWLRRLRELAGSQESSVSSVRLSSATVAELCNLQIHTTGTVLVRYATETQFAAESLPGCKFRTSVLSPPCVQHAARRAVLAIAASGATAIFI